MLSLQAMLESTPVPKQAVCCTFPHLYTPCHPENCTTAAWRFMASLRGGCAGGGAGVVLCAADRVLRRPARHRQHAHLRAAPHLGHQPRARGRPLGECLGSPQPLKCAGLISAVPWHSAHPWPVPHASSQLRACRGPLGVFCVAPEPCGLRLCLRATVHYTVGIKGVASLRNHSQLCQAPMHQPDRPLSAGHVSGQMSRCAGYQ